MKTNRNIQPQPTSGNRRSSRPPVQPGQLAPTSGDEPLAGSEEASEANQAVEQPVNVFLAGASSITQQALDKVRELGTVRQLLAEAHDKFLEAGVPASTKDEPTGLAKEATEKAARAAHKLFLLQTSGAISKDEVSSILVDIWGAKPRKDGQVGKTPNGQGEAIRKRVTRAVDAFRFVQSGEPTAFFKGLDSDAVADIVDEVQQGELSIYSAYTYLADMKKGQSTRVPMAFDAKRIAAFAAKLAEPASIPVIAQSQALQAAYSTLRRVIDIQGVEVGKHLLAMQAAEAEITDDEEAFVADLEADNADAEAEAETVE